MLYRQSTNTWSQLDSAGGGGVLVDSLSLLLWFLFVLFASSKLHVVQHNLSLFFETLISPNCCYPSAGGKSCEGDSNALFLFASRELAYPCVPPSQPKRLFTRRTLSTQLVCTTCIKEECSSSIARATACRCCHQTLMPLQKIRTAHTMLDVSREVDLTGSLACTLCVDVFTRRAQEFAEPLMVRPTG